MIEGQQSALLSVRIDGNVILPDGMEELNQNLIRFDYGDIAAFVSVKSHPDYTTFRLDSISNNEKTELIIWGPIPLNIDETIGETIGVVSNDDIAVGIQSLNPKTLGGYPWNENDCMPQIDIFEGDDFTDLSEKGKRYVLYRVEAAKPIEGGSSLQCYCRNRNEERIIENWGLLYQ